MKNPMKTSYTLITLSLVLIIGVCIIFISFFYLDSTYVRPSIYEVWSIPSYALWLSLLIIVLLPIAWIMMLIGMLSLLGETNRTIIGLQTRIGLIMWIILLPIIIASLEITSSIKEEFIDIFLLNLMILWTHISIVLPIYRIGGKKSFFTILFLSIFGMIWLFDSISNDSINETMFWMTISYLIPLIINIVSYRKLLRWGDGLQVEGTPNENCPECSQPLLGSKKTQKRYCPRCRRFIPISDESL